MTGRVKDQQAKAAKADLEERGAELTMMNSAQADDEEHGVFDGQSGDRVDLRDAQNRHVVIDDEGDDDESFRFAPQFAEEEPTLTGKESAETLAPIIAARRQHAAPPAHAVRSSMATIRVDQDIEDMTYGVVNGRPNNFTLREGLKYRLPLPVAEHLNDLGLVRQWF
jgi:hypothetical protein